MVFLNKLMDLATMLPFNTCYDISDLNTVIEISSFVEEQFQH